MEFVRDLSPVADFYKNRRITIDLSSMLAYTGFKRYTEESNNF